LPIFHWLGCQAFNCVEILFLHFFVARFNVRVEYLVFSSLVYLLFVLLFTIVSTSFLVNKDVRMYKLKKNKQGRTIIRMVFQLCRLLRWTISSKLLYWLKWHYHVKDIAWAYVRTCSMLVAQTLVWMFLSYVFVRSGA